MATPRPSRKSAAAAGGGVDALLSALDHPHKQGIELLRRVILGVDERLREEVKWNAPSFMLDDHFATFKLHPPGSIQLVLHTGAKPKSPPRQFVLEGVDVLPIRWAAPDRCIVTIGSTESARAHSRAVASLVRQWMAQL